MKIVRPTENVGDTVNDSSHRTFGTWLRNVKLSPRSTDTWTGPLPTCEESGFCGIPKMVASTA